MVPLRQTTSIGYHKIRVFEGCKLKISRDEHVTSFLLPLNATFFGQALPSRTMGEVVNVLVAFAVIVFLLRWITTGERDAGSF